LISFKLNGWFCLAATGAGFGFYNNLWAVFKRAGVFSVTLLTPALQSIGSGRLA